MPSLPLGKNANGFAFLFGTLLLALPAPLEGAQAPPAAGAGSISGEPASRSIVLTFDDVPATGTRPCELGIVDDINQALLATLARHQAPAVAFAVESRACGPEPEAMLARILAAWLDAGHEIGNHGASHLDLNSVDLSTYVADLERGARVANAVLEARGERLMFFRPPYLHMGPTEEKRSGLMRYLRDNGYKVGAVTMDNQEWVYSRAYENALERGDRRLAQRVVEAYLEHMTDVFDYYEVLSIELTGREIPQVLLLHANRINADHLDGIIQVLVGRGYEFVSLREALADPAYRLPDDYAGPRGLSWLQRWALAQGIDVPPEPREARWVAQVANEAAAAPPDGPDGSLMVVSSSASEEEAVGLVLNRYLAGHATGLGAHFDSAFHADARLFWAAGGELRTRTAADYIAAATGSPAPQAAERSIGWIEVSGSVAVARVDLAYPRARFTDYMTLVKSSGEWRIVNKAYHIERTGESPPVADRGDVRAQIAAASRSFSDAYVAGDSAAIRDLYTEDAVLLPPEGEVRGRDAIVRYFRPNPGRENIAHAMTSADLRISWDRAIDAGEWSNTWSVDGGSPREATGKYLVVWRRGADGRWRIEYDAWHRP